MANSREQHASIETARVEQRHSEVERQMEIQRDLETERERDHGWCIE